MFPASWSVVDAVPTVDPEALFSATERFEKVMSLGASLAFVTVIVNFFGELVALAVGHLDADRQRRLVLEVQRLLGLELIADDVELRVVHRARPARRHLERERLTAVRISRRQRPDHRLGRLVLRQRRFDSWMSVGLWLVAGSSAVSFVIWIENTLRLFSACASVTRTRTDAVCCAS